MMFTTKIGFIGRGLNWGKNGFAEIFIVAD